MVEKFKCSCCRLVYELSWDDSDDLWTADVEELDQETYNDLEECYEPRYCPFCGSDITEDDIVDLDDY
jgi:hypothetical protein